jgi:LppP/LprE lipoprotein
MVTVFRSGCVALAAAALLVAGGTASAQSMARHAAAGPSSAQITARMRHTIEIGTKGEYFRLVGKPLTIKDGRGTGTVTAAIGGRYPTADAKGQIVFFWHNATFDSLAADYETTAVAKLASPGVGAFDVTYVRYKSTDPTCCPSLKPIKVTYGWSSGNTFISNGVPPHVGKKVRVKYQP